MRFALILLVFALSASLAKPLFLEDVLQKIPQEERVNFIKHHLTLGNQMSHYLTENLQPKSEDTESPLSFSLMLYDYAVKLGQVTDPEKLRMIRDVICFEDGICIDIGDIGVHP